MVRSFSAFLSLLVFAACNGLESPCNIRPSVEARDTTVQIRDTVRLRAESRDPCGEPLRFLWSFDQGRSFDTTETGTLLRVFAYSDVGTHEVRVHSLNHLGKRSGAADIQLTVAENPIAYRPAADTVTFFADTAVAVDLTPVESLSGIAWYCLGPWPEGPCLDSSRTPRLTLRATRGLHRETNHAARIRFEDGSWSAPAKFVLRSRALSLGRGDGYSLLASSLERGTIRVLMPGLVPNLGIRVVDLDSAGRVALDFTSGTSVRGLHISHMALGTDGAGHFFGGAGPTSDTADLVMGAVEVSGRVSWTRSFEVDTGETRVLAIYPLEREEFRVVLSSPFADEERSGALAVHTFDLDRDGILQKSKRNILPDLGASSLVDANGDTLWREAKNGKAVVHPEGWGPFDADRNIHGTLLSALNGPSGSLLRATDPDGVEKWRIAFARGATDASLRQVIALADGTFLVAGTRNIEDYAGGPTEALVLVVDNLGRIR